MADSERLHAIFTDESVRRFLWDGEVIPLERTHALIDKSRELFEARAFGIWGLRELAGGDLLGFAGYWHFRDPPSLELLFGVAPNAWNLGIATEAARCLVDYAFEVLGFPSVEASTDFGNSASVRVLEKLGLRFRRRDTIDGLDTLFYSVTRQD